MPPTAFPSDGRYYLLYELHLTNYEAAPLIIKSIEILDAEAPGVKLLATFGVEQLRAMVQYVGGEADSNHQESIAIAAGQSAIVYMMVGFKLSSEIPGEILHRVVVGDSFAEGAIMTTNRPALRVLGPPLEGTDWLADDGPSNDPQNHHRRGITIIEGRAVISRRYAIDWVRVKGDGTFHGDARDLRSYYAFHKAVLAVADGVVITATDGLPNNVPGHGDAFHPAVSMTLGTVTGNTIALDIGDGQFAYYFHLQPGSVQVRSGDRVHRGQKLAQVGCSGDAREPHLHFEVTNSPTPLLGEGLPYVIDSYRSKGGDGRLQPRTHELPLDKSVVEFGAGLAGQ